MKDEIKFNIPKDKEDKRRLLIDLESNVGVILREDKGFFVVTKYKKDLTQTQTVNHCNHEKLIIIPAKKVCNWCRKDFGGI